MQLIRETVVVPKLAETCAYEYQGKRSHAIWQFFTRDGTMISTSKKDVPSARSEMERLDMQPVVPEPWMIDKIVGSFVDLAKDTVMESFFVYVVTPEDEPRLVCLIAAAKKVTF